MGIEHTYSVWADLSRVVVGVCLAIWLGSILLAMRSTARKARALIKRGRHEKP